MSKWLLDSWVGAKQSSLGCYWTTWFQFGIIKLSLTLGLSWNCLTILPPQGIVGIGNELRLCQMSPLMRILIQFQNVDSGYVKHLCVLFSFVTSSVCSLLLSTLSKDSGAVSLQTIRMSSCKMTVQHNTTASRCQTEGLTGCLPNIMKVPA